MFQASHQVTIRAPRQYFSLSFFLLSVFAVTSLTHSSWSPKRVARAQTSLPTSPGYSTNSPHWSHIHIADLGRDLKYLPYGSIRQTGYQWYADHIDMMEVGMDTFVYTYIDDATQSAKMKALNPTFTTYGYDFDLTSCLHAGCYDGPQLNATNNSVPEDQFLHFSQDTHLKFVKLDGTTYAADVFIPGCPEPAAISSTCRVQEYMYADTRYPFNVKNTNWQQWYATHLINDTYTNKNGQADPVDGIFLDEHGIGYSFSHSIGVQTIILSGGAIREYGDKIPRPVSGNPPDAFDTEYTNDVNAWLTALRVRFDAAGKFIMVNTAEYFMNPLLFTENVAAGGVYTELLHAPDHFRFGATQYQQFIDQIHQLTSNGGVSQLSFGACAILPDGYTGGSYLTGDDRYKMWNLASYYMVREFPTETGRAYFDANLCIHADGPDPLDFEQQWLSAYEKNVGQPIDAASVLSQGTQSCDAKPYKIFVRHYTNATVLVRPRGGYDCTEYGDTTAVTVPLNAPMEKLNPDGTLSAPMNSIQIRNADAVILFPAADTTAPSAVQDLVVD